MRFLTGLAGLILLLPAFGAEAAAVVTVEALAPPAWVFRNGQPGPASVGLELAPGEILKTGAGGRARLRLPDGSTFKLGENSRFFVADSTVSTEAGRLFRATLRVLTGAFRFTTPAPATADIPRDVTIRLPTLTAGIRGTDVWGKALDGRERIVLIEGKVGVRADSGEEVSIERHLSMVEKNPGVPLSAATPITPADLETYALETEITNDSAGQERGGPWKVTALATRAQREALAVYDRLRAAGFHAVIEPTGQRSSVIYRVRLTGLASRQGAIALADRIRGSFGMNGTAVSR